MKLLLVSSLILREGMFSVSKYLAYHFQKLHRLCDQESSGLFTYWLAGYTSGFPAALSLMSLCLFSNGFHNSGTVPNPQDLAPKHSGTVFGVMNGIGCIPGSPLIDDETHPAAAAT